MYKSFVVLDIHPSTAQLPEFELPDVALSSSDYYELPRPLLLTSHLDLIASHDHYALRHQHAHRRGHSSVLRLHSEPDHNQRPGQRRATVLPLRVARLACTQLPIQGLPCLHL